MYQSLYRKYRPKTFNDVVGQDVIIKTLKNSIKNNKISHAYLFIGPRGTGKTSTAKILARSVNCLGNNDGDLCTKCEMCKVTENTDCLDIIEIDAASNNGVDEIRNLREKVNLVPSELKYKVYIIDEVHMLTIQAFNALLKTLEEPPEHIIFILATTDPQKIPETIVSRCQCYNFSRISDNNIVKNLTMVAEKEKINVDTEVLENIALVSDGGMRDSLGMLDKLSSYSTEKITIDDFLQLNGLVTNDDLTKLIKSITNNDIAMTVSMIEDWNSKGKNLIQVMIQFLNYLKNILIAEYINNSNIINIDTYQKLANLINEKTVDIKKSSNPKIYIEIMILNFMNSNAIISREIIVDKNLPMESNVSRETKEIIADNHVINTDKEPIKKKASLNVNTCSTSEKNIVASNIKKIMDVRINNAFIDATKDDLNSDKEKFKKLNDYTFDQKIGYLVCTLLDGNLRLSSKDYLVISYEYDSVVINNLTNLDNMQDVLKSILDITKKLIIISDVEWLNYAKKFVENKNNNINYEYIEEPKLMFDSNVKKNNKLQNSKDNNSASDIFGDIVEVY